MNNHEPVPNAEASDAGKLPPRRAAHPSSKAKWTAWFYRTLLALFVLLTGGLLVWGYQSVQPQ